MGPAPGAHYLFETIGLFVIFLCNLPKYLYRVALAFYHKKRIPSYKHIFHIPQSVEKPFQIKLIGFAAIVFFFMAVAVLSLFGK
jgi:hypothetical protein